MTYSCEYITFCPATFVLQRNQYLLLLFSEVYESFYAVGLFFLLVVPLADAETARVVVFLVAGVRLLVPRAGVFFAAVVRVAVFLRGVAASVLLFVAVVVVAGSV